MKKVITYQDMHDLKAKLEAEAGLTQVVHIEGGQALLEVTDTTPRLTATVRMTSPDGRTKIITRTEQSTAVKYEHEGKEITEEVFNEDPKAFKKRKEAEKEAKDSEPPAAPVEDGEVVRGEG